MFSKVMIKQRPEYYDSVTRKGSLHSFGISRLTKNHQYKLDWGGDWLKL